MQSARLFGRVLTSARARAGGTVCSWNKDGMNERRKKLVTLPQLELTRTIKGHKRSNSVLTEAFQPTHVTARMRADHPPTQPAPTPLPGL